MHNQLYLTNQCSIEFVSKGERYICFLHCKTNKDVKTFSYIVRYMHGVRIGDIFIVNHRKETFHVDTLFDRYHTQSLEIPRIWSRHYFAWNEIEMLPRCYDVFHSRIVHIIKHRLLIQDNCLIHLKYCTLVSAKEKEEENPIHILAVPATSRGDVDVVSTKFIGKTILDRTHYILCLSENPVHRWIGYHWIPKEALIEQKMIPMGNYSGKKEFAVQMKRSDLNLWTDDYRVKFS